MAIGTLLAKRLAARNCCAALASIKFTVSPVTESSWMANSCPDDAEYLATELL